MITFRPALPQDWASVLPLIYSSGPEQFEYLFTQPGRPAQRFLQSAFVSGVGLFGYRVYTVTLVEQRPVAIGGAYGRREGKALKQQMLIQILRFYGLRAAWPVIRHAIALDAMMPFPEPDMFYFAQLGVAETMRGQGIGTAWLQYQIRQARERGYQRCALDVASTNPRAQALYERVGFRVTGERAWPHSASGTHMPNMRRMELRLS